MKVTYGFQDNNSLESWPDKYSEVKYYRIKVTRFSHKNMLCLQHGHSRSLEFRSFQEAGKQHSNHSRIHESSHSKSIIIGVFSPQTAV